MYKAIIHIGDFKPGDIVPDEIAEVWLKMYVEPPVEKIEEKASVKVIEEKKDKEVKASTKFGKPHDRFKGRFKKSGA